MIRYFDASALVKRYVEEPHGEAVRELLDAPAGTVPATSRLSEVEIASALVRRWREGDLSEPELDRALTSLNDDFTALTVVELVPEITALARRLLLAHPLRAGDAIQLASSAFLQKKVGRPIEFLAFDGRLNAAAAKEGLRAAPS
ncbi:MAG TPA: type II toxin-antitoxin system VapC family toxin [Thermoanaerobaculia bacterium]|nr:type II toxin-antitoxin system VapC family toxin [Thermoanaerobaculia bacterium]